MFLSSQKTLGFDDEVVKTLAVDALEKGVTELFAKVGSLVRMHPRTNMLTCHHLTAAAAFITLVDRPRTLHRNFRCCSDHVYKSLCRVELA